MAFERWMEATGPPGAVPRNYSTAPGVGVQTMEGALAATWHAVCLSLCQAGELPTASVVLLPLVPGVASEAGMLALQRHLRSCRDCCAGFGKRLEMQTLHPSSDAGRASPVPALTLSSRVGPPLRLGSDGEEVEEAELEEAEVEEARQALERLILVEGGASETAEAADVLGTAVGWFADNFATIHRLVGARQRRRVLQAGGAEELYAAFWAEAALLVGEAPLSPDDGHTEAPPQPMSSLLVLPGLQEPGEFRKLLRSLQLGLAALNLEQRVSLSAVHPADTYGFVQMPDGSRVWRQALAYPLLHIMSKVPLAQRVGVAATTPVTPATHPAPTTPAAKHTTPARPVVAAAQVVRVYGGRGAAVAPAREPAHSKKGLAKPPPPYGFEWGLSC